MALGRNDPVVSFDRSHLAQGRLPAITLPSQDTVALADAMRIPPVPRIRISRRPVDAHRPRPH